MLLRRAGLTASAGLSCYLRYEWIFIIRPKSFTNAQRNIDIAILSSVWNTEALCENTQIYCKDSFSHMIAHHWVSSQLNHKVANIKGFKCKSGKEIWRLSELIATFDGLPYIHGGHFLLMYPIQVILTPEKSTHWISGAWGGSLIYAGITAFLTVKCGA